jgi:hypothetical protein
LFSYFFSCLLVCMVPQRMAPSFFRPWPSHGALEKATKSVNLAGAAHFKNAAGSIHTMLKVCNPRYCIIFCKRWLTLSPPTLEIHHHLWAFEALHILNV